MTRKLLNASFIILFAFLCPLSLIVAAGGGSLLLAADSADEPSEVAITMRSPQTVNLDDSFTIDVLVINEADVTQTLDDIDLNPRALDAFEVVRTMPPHESTSSDSFFFVYWFDREIPPGERLTVSFDMVAVQTGAHRLTLGVCINVPTSCTDFERVITVRERP